MAAKIPINRAAKNMENGIFQSNVSPHAHADTPDTVSITIVFNVCFIFCVSFVCSFLILPTIRSGNQDKVRHTAKTLSDSLPHN